MPNTPSKTSFVIPLTCGAILIGAFLLSGRTPVPADPTEQTELDPSGPDMLSVFAANPDKAEARVHAAEFGAICRKAATTVVLDGQRGEKVRLKNTLDAHEYRADLRWYAMDGWSFSSKYPALKDAVGVYLDKKLGTVVVDKNTGLTIDKGTLVEELTPEIRARWAAALVALSQNSQYAAERIK